MKYQPKTINMGDFRIPDELNELIEKIAEHVHDMWAIGRINEGWVYGESRNDELKTTPCLVPYNELPENEKQYDRNTAIVVIKLMMAYGYKVEKA